MGIKISTLSGPAELGTYYYIAHYLQSTTQAVFLGPFPTTQSQLSFADITSDFPGDYISQGVELSGEKAVSHVKTNINLLVDTLLSSLAGSYAYNCERLPGFGWSMIENYLRFNSSESLQSSWHYVFKEGREKLVDVYLYGREHMWGGYSRINEIVFSEYAPVSKPIRGQPGYSSREVVRMSVTKTKLRFFTNGVKGVAQDRLQKPYANTIHDIVDLVYSSARREGVDLNEVSYTEETSTATEYWTPHYGKSVVYDVADPASIARTCNVILDDVMLIPETDTKSFGELAGEAAASADSNAANMIAFVRDLKDVKQLIPKIKNLGMLKTHAENYLGLNYGILPTVSDLESIYQATQKEHWTDSFGNQVLTSGHQTTLDYRSIQIAHTRRCRLAVSNDSSDFSAAIRKWRDSGFFPSPQNLWDLVPYSFVLDWFIDIGSFLEQIDSYARIGQLPIQVCTTSDKYVIDIMKRLKGVFPSVTGTAQQTRYYRYVSNRAPKAELKFNSEVTAQNHMVEGAALILVNKK